MPLFDMPLEEMRVYKPPRDEPDDFDAFWAQTLAEARDHDLNAVFEPADFGMATLDVYDATFSGFNGERIKGWYMRPSGNTGPLPAVIEYIGYGGGRAFPIEWLSFPSAGFAYLVMDTRGQGSVWSRGDTPDYGSGVHPSAPGFMTQGILDPQTYYYRRLITDAVRAVEAISTRAEVDSTRIAVNGQSQGGGMSIAVAGLRPDVKVCLADVPFLQHFRRAIEITPSDPYPEIARFLQVHRDKVETVLRTLSYCDGMNFAARMTARALYSVGVMDTTCPPSTVYASYNHVNSEKEIVEYYFNNHEGGGFQHKVEKIRYLRRLWLE